MLVKFRKLDKLVQKKAQLKDFNLQLEAIRLHQM